MALVWLIAEGIFLLLVIAVASEFLAYGAEVLEHKFGAGFVGSVILGFITMLPELIFVLVAIKAMETDVALGSAIGGNILLFTLGFGMVIVLAYYKHGEMITLPKNLKDDLWYLLGTTLFLIIASLDNQFDWFEGLVLFVSYFIFVIHQFIEAQNLPTDGEEDQHVVTGKKWAKSGTFMLIGAILLVIAAEPFVHVIVGVSDDLHISAAILALIISPIASELPEKISAFTLSTKSLKGAEIAVANFIGSKVQANTLLFGAMILYNIFLFGENIFIGDNILQLMLAVLTTIVGVFVAYDLKLHLKEGLLVVFLYIFCVIVVLI
ncbi:MAG: sodium:calcium antiporter [Candidatus Hodarchaeales archaeon]|jgi:cation:H+ antiporter